MAGGVASTVASRTSLSEKDQYQVVLAYLAEKGHTRAEAALRLDLGADANAPSPAAGAAANSGGRSVGLEDFAARNAPSAPRNAAVAAASAAATAGAVANGKRRPDQSVASGQLLADPPSWEKGYEGLRTFVENSLDIHRPELLPLLLPLFVHSYLDLVLSNYREAADHFMNRFAVDHNIAHPHIIRMLSALRLPHHVSEAEEATRWRAERYNVRLSERGWGLLLGWVQGGGLAGSIEGTDSRGRDRVLAIINERVKVDAIPGPPSQTAFDFGLTSELGGKHASKGQEDLKLGPAPVDPKLEREVERAVKEDEAAAGSSATGGSNGSAIRDAATSAEASTSSIPTSVDFAEADPKANALPSLISPRTNETLPYPSTLRTLDVAREVEKVREGRKRIRLGAEAFNLAPGAEPKVGGAAKPSVCLFTLHDAGESLNITSFSEDSTLMAAGFSESYIRLWNLKGGKLPGIRADFDSDDVTDAAGLKSIREKNGPTSRKLIGHSGPVYALSFDPVPGPSAPPRYLLSSSQDATIRLWSLETYSNLVVYRGHREPVWDVQWGPRGIYFASASRDRTARLWITDKVSAVRIFAGHLSDVNCVRFHPNSLYIATGSSDRTCRLWDVQKGTCVRVFVGHRGSVTTIAISPDGRYLASGAEDLSLILWDLSSGAQLKSMTGHTSSINSLSFSSESTVLASGSSDGTVRVWDVIYLPPSASSSTALLTKTGGSKSGRKHLERSEMRLAEKMRKGSEMALAKGGLGAGGSIGGGAGDNKAVAMMGLLPKSSITEKEIAPSADLLCSLATKRTPILNVHFTPRNLCLAAGPMFEG